MGMLGKKRARWWGNLTGQAGFVGPALSPSDICSTFKLKSSAWTPALVLLARARASCPPGYLDDLS